MSSDMMMDPKRWEGYVVDPKRVVRSRSVRITNKDERGNELPDRHYMAATKGSEDVHYLCTVPGQVTCDCGDFEWQNHDYGERDEVVCKHILRALLFEGEDEVRDIASDVGLL